jgi:hypothetical protein
VDAALAQSGIDAPLRGVLCFVGSVWPRVFRRPLQFGAVTAVWPDGLPAIINAAGPLDGDAIARTAATLARAFPAA